MQADLSAGHCEPARKRRHRRQINSTNDTGSAFILCLMLRVLFDREGKRCMTFASARLLLVIASVVLPYAARLPFGLEWVRQYTDVGLGGWLLLGGFNAIAWSALLGISFLYRRPIALLVPCLIGFGVLAWAHATVDLRADAQSALALIFIPVYALLPITLGGVLGYLLDRKLRRSAMP